MFNDQLVMFNDQLVMFNDQLVMFMFMFILHIDSRSYVKKHHYHIFVL